MLALVIRVVSHQKVGVFSMQEAEAINSQVEGIESKMDGSFPLLMETVSWFQQYQEGSPVAVPNPEAPVCSQHHSAARHSNAPQTIRHRPGERQAQPQRTMALRCLCPSIHDTQRPNIGGAFQLDATGSLVKRHRRLGCGYFGPRHSAASAASGGYVINAAECLWSLASTASHHRGGRHLALVLCSGSQNHTSTQW